MTERTAQERIDAGAENMKTAEDLERRAMALRLEARLLLEHFPELEGVFASSTGRAVITISEHHFESIIFLDRLAGDDA